MIWKAFVPGGGAGTEHPQCHCPPRGCALASTISWSALTFQILPKRPGLPFQAYQIKYCQEVELKEKRSLSEKKVFRKLPTLLGVAEIREEL